MTTSRPSSRLSQAALATLDRSLPARDARRKRELLAVVASARFGRARDLVRLQRIACFITAFPEDRRVLRAARVLADRFHERVRHLAASERARLDDSGMAGTVTRHVYCASAARWLAQRFGASVEVDWPALSGEAIATLLAPTLHPLERDLLEFNRRTTRRWLERARGERSGTALAWLLAQAPKSAIARERFEHDFEAAEVPLAWRLADGAGGIARNLLRTRLALRADGMRRPGADARAAILRPLESMELLPRRAALRVVDVWRAALWSRTRTTLHVERPNLDECYLADFGGGLQMAALGIEPAARDALEPSFGYLLMANGVPIGYGGFTPLFAQVNTGINVFPEFRGSEAAFAFEQALRLMHTLTGCARFLINPYQFGAGNDEALQSGAYWFYYRLGFRSIQGAVQRLAEREFGRLQRDRTYRVPIALLRRLAACDLCLDLTADAARRGFDERWLPPLVNGIADASARTGEPNRAAARRKLAVALAGILRIDLTAWSRRERESFELLAPIVAQVDDVAQWSSSEKDALAKLCRLRLAPREREYVERMRDHDRLREALARAAQRAAGSGTEANAP
ncbi:MAG TPA: hypothetical protein VMN79_05265 [Casimicrobiaceae bacterium]|nr:hypothetical protein [Casimicrobiaceae bacterium]